MRFGELRGLSSLPIPQLRDQFRNEEVLTVLPAQEAVSAHETLFVATRAKLAVLITLQEPRGQWMTRWAPWDSVSVSGQEGPPAQDEDVYRLRILVGSQAFHAQLRGETGRKALRDFVVSVRTLGPTQHAKR